MLNKVKYLVVALLLYIVFLVALFPANYAINTVKEMGALPPNVSLGNATGSVWKGRLSSVNYDGITFENIRWDLSVLSILTGSLNADVKIGQRGSKIKGDGRLSYSAQGLSVNDLTLNAPVDYLTTLSPLPYGLTSTGKMNLSINEFIPAQPWCSNLAGQVTITEVLVQSGFGQLAVDKVTAVLSCPQGRLQATLQPSTNTLGINGTAYLTKKRGYVLDAKIVPPASASNDYLSVLNFSGQPNAQGQYVFKYNGQL